MDKWMIGRSSEDLRRRHKARQFETCERPMMQDETAAAMAAA
jgi:hypothetical protein